MAGAYYKYRNYQHDGGDAKVEVTRASMFDDRGFRRSTKVSHKVTGYLHGSSVSALTTNIRSMEAAYAVDGGNAGLYDESGAVTGYFLNSLLATVSGGVRVVSGPNFPYEPGTYTTYVPYEIVLEAEFPGIIGDDVMHFRETVELIGTGAEKWVLIPTLYGPPRRQIVNRQTPYRAVQSGSAVGFSSYPKPPGPLWPTAEHSDMRPEAKEGPVIVNGRLKEFGITWQYIFESATPLVGEPNVR